MAVDCTRNYADNSLKMPYSATAR